MTRIFSTNRGVREFYSNFSKINTLLPKAITVSEFESKAILVKNRSFIDNESRFLLMREAADFKEFEKLQFDSDFLIFLNHSQYLFNFFDELASENIKINVLRDFDTYALFDEHLDILENLKQRYEKLLDEKSFVDKINIGKLYTLNEDYLKNLGEIHIQLDGFLSRYEITLFQKCSKIIPFYINFELNSYNKKSINIFEKQGFDLKQGYSYEIDLTNSKILTCKEIKREKAKTEVKIFNTRVSQIGFVNSTIAKFIGDGLMPENIAVVLPDESLAEYLKEFDTYKNLNFAMGFSLKNSNLYKRIEAISLYQNTNEDEERYRVKRLDISQDLLYKIKNSWKKRLPYTETISFINELLVLDVKESEQEVFKEEIFRFSKFLSRLDLLNLEQHFKLFLKRLKEKSQDDIRGGKITVMGLLETRGASFEGVIVPDFSDEFVPRRSGKDLFLNTQIRKSVDLPTKKDREDLQKYYYNQLFSNAKKVAICSVTNETTIPSRFLDELGLKYEANPSSIYNTVLFKKRENFTPLTGEIKNVSYNLTQSDLTATKLNTLLTCKRKFYYRYIKRVREPQNILTDSNAKIGLKLHSALERVFSQSDIASNPTELFKRLKEALLSDKMEELEEFEIKIWLQELGEFVKNEEARYKQGYQIYKNEVELKSKFEGFNIKGKIDRIDIKDNKFYIIDYKSGNTDKLLKQKIQNETNFQLEFYYLLASSMGEVDGVYYYDLKSAKLIPEVMFGQKLEKLKDILKDLKEPLRDFELCEKHSTCLYCPYKKLCLR